MMESIGSNVHLKKRIKIIFYTLLIVQIILAGMYFLKNITFIPLYGDTSEYLSLATTSTLDAYRQPLYPWFLKFCNWIEMMLHGKILLQTIVYIFQLSACFIALFSLLIKIAPSFSKKQKYKYIFIATFFLFTNPLIFHFNMTISPDGLCLSSFAFFLCGCLLLFPIENYKAGIPVYIFFFITTALLRSEKACVLLGSTIIMAIVLFYKKKITSKKFKAAVLVSLCAFLLFSGISYITHVSSEEDENRTVNIERIIFTKTVWPRLERVYQYLPEEIQMLITPEETAIFDDHPNNIRYYADRLENESGGSNNYLWTISKISFLTFPLYYKYRNRLVITSQTR